MSNLNIDYLVVAGGGAGGYRANSSQGTLSWYNGGGGAGGFLNGSTSFTSGVSINLNVGAGGAAYSGTYTFARGNKGGNSYISQTGVTTIEAEGGGYGAAIVHPQSDPNVTSQNGGPGGSGGGASGWNNVNSTGGSGIIGQGSNGGNGVAGGDGGAGGGGGAGSAGTANSGSGGFNGGNGGNGLQSSITGSYIYYASGAKGGRGWSGSSGADGNNGTGYRGVPNSGDGGQPNGSSSAGYSGIIILRYATADVSSYTTTGITPIETTDGTDTILSFTTVGVGTITFTSSIPPFSGTTVSNEMLDLNQQNNEIGLRIPVGDDANQPTPDVSNTGSIRYNTDHQALSISNGTEFQMVDSEESTLPTVTLTNSWRAWDTASFTNGGTTCTDVTGGLVLGPYSSGSPGAFFYGSFNNVAGNKYWVLNGGGSHGRRAGFTRPTEFTISYWGNKPSNPGYNSERAIWTFNTFGSENIRLARRNNAGTSSLRIYSGNSSIATFADGITTNTWYNITLTFSLNTVKTYVGVQGSTNTTLINTTTLSSGNFPTGILNANGTGFWIGTNSGYTDWSTDSWSGLNIYDGVARQAEIDTIVSNGYQQ